MFFMELSKYACPILVFAAVQISVLTLRKASSKAKPEGPGSDSMLLAGLCRRWEHLWKGRAPDDSARVGARLSGWARFYPFNVILKRRRKNRLEIQLPDVLELAGHSLSAGLSLLQALEAAARDAPQPADEIFKAVVRDIRLGLPPEEALLKTSLIWKHEDLTLFAVAAAVSGRTGANLAAMSCRLVQTMRERRQWQGRLSALTAQARLSGWVVGLLPIGLLAALTFLDPELMGEFFQQPLAWMMLTCGLALECLGVLWIRMLMRMEV